MNEGLCGQHRDAPVLDLLMVAHAMEVGDGTSPVDWGALDDDAWYDRLKADLGMDARPGEGS